MTIIIYATCKEAKANNHKTYFTGKLCKRGHLAERFVTNHMCVECNVEDHKRWVKDNPEKQRK